MAVTKKNQVSRKVKARAGQLLQFAQKRAETAADWLELHSALFGIEGKANALFPTLADRALLQRTSEYNQILALMDSMPRLASKGMGQLISTANGAISVRLPRSIHAALLAEAKAEGVSLNQLCLSKLATQLRTVVCPE